MYLGELSFRLREKPEQRPCGRQATVRAKIQGVLSSRTQRVGTQKIETQRSGGVPEVIVRIFFFFKAK